MSAGHMSTTSSRGGCGCGSGGASSGLSIRTGNSMASTGSSCGVGCSCGGTGCGSCEGQDFVRPRFFAGQLLTEEDLDLLTSYVVEKNRLHNRHFLGDGVVCGLTVTCDPCGGGKVTVRPGHALDCCGNDIVLSCAQTLDINAMIRRMRIEKSGGVDCGDPCAAEKARDRDPQSALSTGYRMTDEMKRLAPPPLPPAEYCLYVRYCESMTDPVSPYATDDPCGAQACEPTRVREGFTFELRCKSCEEPPKDDLFTRLAACFGNLTTAGRSAQTARSAYMFSGLMGPSLLRYRAGTPILDTARLDGAAAAHKKIAALPQDKDTWTSANAFDAAEASRTLASLVATYSELKPEERSALPNRAAVEKNVTLSKEGLKLLGERVPADEKLAALIEQPLDRDITLATTKRALLWSAPDDAMKTVPGEERALLRSGLVYSPQINSSMASYLALLRANLIERVQARGALTDCTLLRDLQAIALPEDDPQKGPDGTSAGLAQSATEALVNALIRYLRECICDALLPPCPPCDDSAVLLACVTVEGCEVVSICNMERKFVFTNPAIRYWMPFLRSLGDVLEKFCCPSDLCEEPPKPTPPPPAETAPPAAQPDGYAAPAAYYYERPIMMQPRSFMESRSMSALSARMFSPGTVLDPSRIAAFLPARMAFSPESARTLASAASAVLDVVSLRSGVNVRDMIAPTFPGAAEAAAPAPAPAPAGTRVAAAAPPATVDPAMVDEAVTRRVAEVLETREEFADMKVLRDELGEMKKKFTASEKRTKELESRLKKLEE